MTSLVRATIIATVLLGVGCLGPVKGPGGFHLVERTYGIYEIQGQEVQIRDTTTNVPCRLGITFGAELSLELMDASGGDLPLVGELHSPPIEGLRPARKRITPHPFVVAPGIQSGPISAGYSFDRPAELVDGEYTVLFYDSSTDMVLYKRTFHVTDCP